MKTEIVQALTDNFEAHAQQAENGIEFWLARDLQHLLGYDEWRNFTTVISKAKTACEMSGHPVGDHFVDVNKTINLGYESQRKVSQRKFDKMNRTNRIKKSGEHCFTKHPVHSVNPVAGFFCGLL